MRTRSRCVPSFGMRHESSSTDSTFCSHRRCPFRRGKRAGLILTQCLSSPDHWSRFPIGRLSAIRGMLQVSRPLLFPAVSLARGCPWVFKSWADASQMRPFFEQRPHLRKLGRGTTNDRRCELSGVGEKNSLPSVTEYVLNLLGDGLWRLQLLPS